MSRRTYKFILGLLIGLAVSLTAGWARDHERERGRVFFDGRERLEDHDRRHGFVVRDRDDDDREFDFDDRHEHAGRWTRGRAFSFWTFGPVYSNRPPGWDRGRKTGWGNCDVPPGLAKKEGCHPVFFGRNPSSRRGPVIVIPLP